MLADVALNCRWPYANSLLLAPATDDAVVPGAVPDPPAPKRPHAVLVGLVVFSVEGAVDVADLARADRLRRSSVERESSVGRLVDRSCLVLAVRTQATQLVQLHTTHNAITCQAFAHNIAPVVNKRV